MKNRIMVSVLCICILLMTSGCGTGGKSEASSDESIESVTVTESDQEEQTESNDYYEEMTADTEESVINDQEEQTESDDYYEEITAVAEESVINDQEEQMASDDYYEEIATDAEESVVSNQEEHTEPRDYYEELIADARECIEGKVEENPEDYYDFSYIIYWYGAYDGASLGLGYLIEDIDGNGTNELIFGQNADPDSESNGFIYDLYTIFDGELVHVFSGGERYRIYLCENGMIANEGADGACLFKYTYYIFEGTELHLVEAVIYNGWDDRDNPWFYSTQTNSYYDTENLESVSEEQVETIMEKYIYECPTFIPFVEE